MKTMVIYLLETLASSGVLLAAYTILLERRVKFRWCRLYLPVAMAIAAVIPLLRIPVWPGKVIVLEPMPTVAPGAWQGEFPVPETPAVTPEAVCTILYVLGTALILGLMIWQAVRIRGLRRNATILRTSRYTLVRTQRQIASFSFFRSIYVWRETPDEQLGVIVSHEMSHIAHRHTIERIVMECLKAALWWNPFVWIAARRLTEAEEFEADSDVLHSGLDTETYMNTIFKQLFGYSPEIANGLRDSLTKKRFQMMTTNMSGRHSLLRLAGILPAVIGLLCAFSFTTRAAVVQTPDKTETNSNAPMRTVDFTVILKNKDGSFSSENAAEGAIIKSVGSNSGVTTDKEGHASIKVPDGTVLEVMFLGYEPQTVVANGTEPHALILLSPEGLAKPKPTSDSAFQTRDTDGVAHKPLYIVDGRQIADLSGIPTNAIESIEILKDATAIKRYGERGRYGVIEITSKRGAATKAKSAAAGDPKATKQATPEIDPDEPFLTAEVMPTFQGGNLSKFREWTQSQVRFPEEALNNNIQGRVVLQFIIERDGSVSNVNILQSPDKSLSDEVRRVFTKIPAGAWTPGMQGGQKVRIKYTFPVDFRTMTDEDAAKQKAAASAAQPK